MSDYAVQTWTNGVTACNASHMTNIENGIAAVPGIYLLSTPYLVYNSTTINSGSTDTKTYTGVGTPTVPSAATAVLICIYYQSTTVGSFLQLTPHGASGSDLSNYPLGPVVQGSGTVVAATLIVPLSGGQIDAKANNGNITGIHASIYGYIH